MYRPLASLLLLALPALAGETPQVGLSSGLVMPSGSLTRDQGFHVLGGLSFGAHVTQGLSGTWALRGHLQWAGFQSGRDSAWQGSKWVTHHYRAAVTLLDADVLAFPWGERRKGYVVAGIGASRWSFETTDYEASVLPDAASSLSTTTTRGNVHAGLGWQWTRHLGMEVRYVWSRAGGMNACMVQAPFSYTF